LRFTAEFQWLMAATAGRRRFGFGATNWPSNPKTPVEDAPHCGVFRPAETVGHDGDDFAQAEIRQTGKDFRGGWDDEGAELAAVWAITNLLAIQIGYCSGVYLGQVGRAGRIFSSPSPGSFTRIK
jgi:hypothetical protein